MNKDVTTRKSPFQDIRLDGVMCIDMLYTNALFWAILMQFLQN
jgi:hypothetical protein